LIIVVDCCKYSGNFVDGDACGNAAAGHTDAVADEQVAIPASDVVEVDLAIECSADCPHN
jgi:hypothetical protein